MDDQRVGAGAGVTGEHSPRRIQRRRERGWRMPEGAVYVGRPSRWGNPFKVLTFRDGVGDTAAQIVRADAPGAPLDTYYDGGFGSPVLRAHRRAVEEYRAHVVPQLDAARMRSALAGRDLVCWCSLGTPCHADVLLEIANGEVSS